MSRSLDIKGAAQNILEGSRNIVAWVNTHVIAKVRETVDMIKVNEGFVGRVYLDTVGKRTVGYGFNIDDATIARLVDEDVKSGKREMTRAEAEPILYYVIFRTAVKDAMRFVGKDKFFTLSFGQRKAVLDMAFNLGIGRLNGFEKFRTALREGNAKQAAAELLDSKYAGQVNGRAKRNEDLTCVFAV